MKDVQTYIYIKQASK